MPSIIRPAWEGKANRGQVALVIYSCRMHNRCHLSVGGLYSSTGPYIVQSASWEFSLLFVKRIVKKTGAIGARMLQDYGNRDFICRVTPSFGDVSGFAAWLEAVSTAVACPLSVEAD